MTSLGCVALVDTQLNTAAVSPPPAKSSEDYRTLLQPTSETGAIADRTGTSSGGTQYGCHYHTAAVNPPLYDRDVEMEDRHMGSLHQEDTSRPSAAKDDTAITPRALA